MKEIIEKANKQDEKQNKNLTFKEVIKMAEETINKFEKVEGKNWGVEGTLIELQKQVGELAKYVMMAEGYYSKKFYKDHQYAYETVGENIADELSDILYALIRIARYYKIDLEEAYITARKAEGKFIELNKEAKK